MPCSPRTVDGRCHPEKVVYETKGKRVEILIGKKADVKIPGREIIEKFREVSKEDLKNFPEEVHLTMTPDRIRISEVRKGKEETRLDFSRDEKGLKMAKEYDELSIWMALFIGLTKEEININNFYENLLREGFYK